MAALRVPAISATALLFRPDPDTAFTARRPQFVVPRRATRRSPPGRCPNRRPSPSDSWGQRGRGVTPGLSASSQAAAAASSRQQIALPVQDLTPENFAPFGQVCSAQDDGKEYDEEDAQLVLDKGTPRFYIMRLPKTGISFNSITFHSVVTQCLGGLSQDPWYMAVSAPSGSVEAHPTTETLVAFRVPPGTFLKMNEGTWHAGPLFASVEHMNFYNLELSDTNVVDHNTHEYEEVEYVLDV